MENSNQQHKALIIGCGIAGPATALFLKRIGIDSVIYEAEKTNDDYAGLFLNLARNGLRVMDELGIDEPIRQEGIVMQTMKMVSGKGKMLGTVGQSTGEPQGYTIKRGFIHKVLREEALRQGIPIEFGKKLRSIETNEPNRVEVSFEDGSYASGNILIGCDGIHSRTRKIALPNSPVPSYTGLISFGGFVNRSKVPYERGIQKLVFGKRAFFGYMVKPSGEVYWYGNMDYNGQPTRRELQSIPQEEWRKTINGLYANDLDPIPQIVRSTQGEIGVFPIYDMPPVAEWYRKSVVLVGDAVHATSPNAGQGASLALEDAMVLVKCIRDLPNLEQAFSMFQQLRRDRVERIVQYSRSIGQRKHATNPVQVFFRDLMLPMFLKQANKDSLGWMYDYKTNWEDKITV
ncbi:MULTISPECIES: NAD(P)/FAD-dependent oxidoreductase [unclassified Paenibacillus]|uniref:FAD-dependent oxidoreductase n=1 Tax=unclassified Paenibacillus TaxID=185978 RepID=UPI001C106FCD|nr:MULTISPECIES: NAD(P)/FAD-dependent oxidoreductase [unclassified Paenibacillus]MBU5441623.1 FAD-dependent monooxygenase [Paenibacillus sp. MSJ-34]CAH0117706.1 FAD-dependent urate hydroxylase [Paenibacillus sp. CECT 9249]